MTNALYYGDNPDMLREHIADDSMDLPPPGRAEGFRRAPRERGPQPEQQKMPL
jgi:hypothetical protein